MNLIYLYDEFMRFPDHLTGQAVYIIDPEIQEGYEISEKILMYRYQLAEHAGAKIYQGKTLDIIAEIHQQNPISSIISKSTFRPMYQELFQKYFLKSLTSRLTDYSSQKFEVFDSEQKSSNYTIVNSKIVESLKSPEIKIDWRIYTKNPQKPLIRDLIVEGLSLARTQKEEFASILNSNNNDVNALINKLQEFISN